MLRILWIVCWLCLLNTCFSQPIDLKFEPVPEAGGVSQGTVTRILQDREGFLWLGTWSGIACFDGYSVRYFNGDPKGGGVAGNKITCLFEDKDGKIWIGTRNTGLFVFDKVTERFFTAAEMLHAQSDLPTRNITSVFQDRAGRLWVGTEDGLFLYDTAKAAFQEIPIKGQTPPPSETVYLYSIIQTSDGTIWISGSHGLFMSPETTGTPVFRQIPLHPAGASGQEVEYHNFVYCASASGQRKDWVWVGTKHGLKRLEVNPLNPESSKIRHFQSPSGLSHNYVTDICSGNFPQPNALWVATFNGLNLLLPKADSDEYELRQFFSDDEKSGALGSNNIRSLLFDRTGILWIGSDKGLNKLDPHFADFALHPLRRLGGASAEPVFYLSATENAVWASTFGGGIFRTPLRNGQPIWAETRNYHLPSPNSASTSDFVSCLLPDGRGSLWAITQGAGAFLLKEQDFPPNGGTLRKYRQFTKGSSPTSLGDDYLMCGRIGTDGAVWLGTWDSGINIYDPNTDEMLRFPETSDGAVNFRLAPVVVLLEAQAADFQGQYQGRLMWVGTRGNGLFLVNFDRENRKMSVIRHFHPDNSALRHAVMNDLFRDRNGQIWVATENGINYWMADQMKIGTFVGNDRLPSIIVQAITQDDDGQYWATTQNGLASINPQDQWKVTVYNDRNGLSDRFFNSTAALRLPSGQVLLGGNNGITYFRPSAVAPDPNPPVTVLTGLRLFNRPVFPGLPTADGFLLEKSLGYIPQVVFSHLDNVVTFEFTGLHFSCPNQNRFAYKLEGFDPDWVYTDAKQRLAHYTNLPAGDYKFLVKSANSDGIWTPKPVQLSVRVLPPWWRSAWASTVYMIAFLGLLWLIRHMTLIRANYENKIKLERLEKENMAEVNRLKLIFFTNISHELKTPLTLILTPLEEMIRNRSVGNATLQNTLSMMHRNAQRLLTMINQLLDIRKAEAGLMKLEAGRGNVVQFVGEVCLSFRELARAREVQFDFEPPETQIYAWFDPDQMEKVLFNILSNAFKFTPPGGTVSVSMGTDSGQSRYFIQVKDNGKGIPEDKLPFIFERFFRADEYAEESGSGIGLSLVKSLVEKHHGTVDVDSTLGQGSVFTVWLPLEDTAFTEQEKRRTTIYGEETHFYPVAPHAAPVPVTPHEMDEPPRILLVEDNPDIRTYLKNALSAVYEIHEAADGMEGLEKALDLLPDLLICDISMPGKDGLELTRELKSNESTSHIPIVLLTARTSLLYNVEGFESGADDYMTKPFNIKLLEVRIRNLIDSRRHLRERFAQQLTNLKPVETPQVLPELDNKFIQKINELIEANIENPEFSVDDLSAQLYIGRRQLYRKMKAVTDQTPNEYIRTIRLKKAAQLLRTQRYTVAEVTYKVGFQDLKYFRERFRAFFGVNPSELGGPE